MRACESECVSMCVHVCVRVSVHAFMSLAWMREEYWEEDMAEDLPNQFVCVWRISYRLDNNLTTSAFQLEEK